MLAWIWVPPELVLEEITATMVCIGINPKTFRFRVISPIYKPIAGILNDSTALCSENYNFNLQTKIRRDANTDMSTVWKEFI